MNKRQAKKIIGKATYELMPVRRIVKAFRVMWRGHSLRVSDNAVYSIARTANNFARVYERRIK